ncbi:hypothetical protein AAG570_006715 [Ranatra chinensis]|uniref:Uncharacterized protein n=1 Tax=Ranatra chinensis TaxID=642074 RepID=A0ABD0Z5E8_9HEMI
MRSKTNSMRSMPMIFEGIAGKMQSEGTEESNRVMRYGLNNTARDGDQPKQVWINELRARDDRSRDMNCDPDSAGEDWPKPVRTNKLRASLSSSLTITGFAHIIIIYHFNKELELRERDDRLRLPIVEPRVSDNEGVAFGRGGWGGGYTGISICKRGGTHSPWRPDADTPTECLIALYLTASTLLPTNDTKLHPRFVQTNTGDPPSGFKACYSKLGYHPNPLANALASFTLNPPQRLKKRWPRDLPAEWFQYYRGSLQVGKCHQWVASSVTSFTSLFLFVSMYINILSKEESKLLMPEERLGYTVA